MKYPLQSLFLPAVIAAIAESPAVIADTAAGAAVQQCFFECKLFPPGAHSFYQEQTTLMIMNGNQPTPNMLPPHPDTRNVRLVFVDGNERILGKSRLGLSPRDLDEVNVCFTIVENTQAAPPPAGLVLVVATDAFTGAAARDIDVAVKNPVGRMSLDDPEVFNGRVSGVGKTSCFEVESTPVEIIQHPEYQEAPTWAEPVLIERTRDLEPG